MKNEDIYNAVTDINDKYIEEADRKNNFKNKKTFLRRAVAAAAAAAVAFGIFSFSGRLGKSDYGAIAEVVFPKAIAFDDSDARFAIKEQNPVSDDFLNSVNEFSYSTASALLSESETNSNYSPLSLYYALAMAANGAEGDTLDILLSLLGTDSLEKLNLEAGNLYRRFYSDNNIGGLKVANSMWMDDNYSFKQDFATRNAENLYASCHIVDFSSEDTAKTISDWINNNTEGTLNAEYSVSPQQVLALINTVYFHDEWVDKFDKNNTKEDTFYLEDGSEKQCDFMNSKYDTHSFSRGENFTRSYLGLKNSGSMVFILPDEGVTVQSLLSSPESVKNIFEGGEDFSGEVVWQIPKFDFSSSFDLTDMLKDLGIDENSDFSAMSDDMISLSSVIQQTNISIDEKGVEASAFTSIQYSGAMPPEDRADMILNRPFIYGITDSMGDLIFVGVCMDPTAN